MVDFGKSGNRRVMVRENFPVQRNEVALFRIGPKLVQGE